MRLEDWWRFKQDLQWLRHSMTRLRSLIEHDENTEKIRAEAHRVRGLLNRVEEADVILDKRLYREQVTRLLGRASLMT